MNVFKRGGKSKRYKTSHPQYGKLWHPEVLSDDSPITWVAGPAPLRAKRRFAPLYKPGPTVFQRDTSVCVSLLSKQRLIRILS